VSTLGVYKVTYHYSLGGPGGAMHAGLGVLTDFVAAPWVLDAVEGIARANMSAVATILASNGRSTPAGYVLVVESVSNHGVGAVLT
jgi:hypothetical protein